MPTDDKSALAVWLDFAKSLIWPSIVLILSLTYHSQFSDFIAHITKVNAGPLSLEAQARDIQQNISQQAQPGAAIDPHPSLAAVKQALKLQALRTLAQVSPALTSHGWIYCGATAGGHWTEKPNLEVAGPISAGNTYTVATDTYLRENPPQGSTPKGEVIGIFSAMRKPIDMSGSKMTYEELERRSKEPGGRTWAQIRERLLKL